MSGAKGLEPLTFSLRRHRVQMVSREHRVIDRPLRFCNTPVLAADVFTPRRCGQVQLIAALLYAADHPACSWTEPRAVAGVGVAVTSVLPVNDFERCTTSLGSNRTPSVSATASACCTSTTRQPATVGRWSKPSASQSVKDYLTSIVLLHSASTRRKVCLPYVRVGNL